MQIVDTKQLDESWKGLSQSEVYWVYNGLDCCLTREVFDVIHPQLDDVSGYTYAKAMEYVAPLMEMMLEGLRVCEASRLAIAKAYQRDLDKMESRWQRLCVEGLGLEPSRTKRKGRKDIAISHSSPQDIAHLFYGVLGLKAQTRRVKGEASKTTTNRQALEALAKFPVATPFVNYIFAMQKRAKEISFLRLPIPVDGIVRYSLNVAGSKDGSLSSSFMDFGNEVNVETVTGRSREMFVPDNDSAFILLEPITAKQKAWFTVRRHYKVEDQLELTQKIMELVAETRCLVAPSGRRRYFWNGVRSKDAASDAIKYLGIDTMAEFCRGLTVKLWQFRNIHKLDIRFMLSVNNTLLLQVKNDNIPWLINMIKEQADSYIELDEGEMVIQEYSVKVGWNFGDFIEGVNPAGLLEWSGRDTRAPKKTASDLASLLNSKVSELR